MTQVIAAPNSRESEMIVLGCMLNSINSLKVGSTTLSTIDFFYTEHQLIFDVLKRANINDKPADIHLMAEELKRQNNLERSGDVGYLMELAQYAGTSAHIEEYVQIIKNKSILRKLLDVGRNLEKIALSDPSDIQPDIDSIQKELEGIKRNRMRSESLYGHLLIPASEGGISEEIRCTSPGVRVGMTIGNIDLKIPGGALTILAGPTGHGKTLLMINMILNYLKLYPEAKAYFFSYEESRAAILSLFLNTYIGESLSINNRESIKSYFRDGDLTYITESKRKLFTTKKDEFFKNLIESGRLNIFYCDYTTEELTEAIRFLKEKSPTIGLVAVDYMQMLRKLNKKTIQRQEELKEICLLLKDFAVDSGLPVLVGAQFNRTVVNEATISPVAIGEAGDIERAANTIIGIWNRNYEGFSKEGNIARDGTKINKSPSIYLEILKSREVGIGHSTALDLNGNTGKLIAQPENGKNATQKIDSPSSSKGKSLKTENEYDLGKFK